MKKRAERFGDQLGNNENLNLDEKKKRFGKGKLGNKLNRELGNGNGNKRILGNRLKFSNKRRNLRNNRKFEGLRKIRRNGNGNNGNSNANGFTRNRIGARRGGNRRLRGMNRNFNN